MMNREQIDAIIEYVDTKIEYELSSMIEDEEGYLGSCVSERKSMEKAKEVLINVISI